MRLQQVRKQRFSLDLSSILGSRVTARHRCLEVLTNRLALTTASALNPTMLRIGAGLCALLCFWLLHASALAQLPHADNPATALHALFAEDWEYQMEQHPTWASSL